MISNKNHGPRATRWLLSALLIIFIINIGIIIFFKRIDTGLLLSDIFYPLMNLASVFLLLYAASSVKEESPKYARGWAVLCIAQFLFTLGDLLWFYYEIFLQIEPFPSLADIFYVAYYPLALIGISLLVDFDASKKKRINRWLDIAIIFIAFSLFFGATLISPLNESMLQEGFIYKALILAYPVGDIFLLLSLLILVYQNRSTQIRLPIILIALNIITQIVTDVIFSFQSLYGTYESGGWLDAGWLISYFLIGLAGYVQINAPAPATNQKNFWANIDPKKSAFFAPILDLLPYVLVVSAYIFLYINHVENATRNLGSMFISVGSLLILVFVRQFLTMRENSQLNFNLMRAIERITRQTEDLKKVNKRIRQEIKQRKKLEKELAYLALHDPLTGLPNRRLFFDRLEHGILISRRNPTHHLAIIFLDIDDLKLINDKYGHDVGDQALIQFSERISGLLRKSDTFARLGGDEFVILLENKSSMMDAVTFTQRIQTELGTPLIIGGETIQMSVSMGIISNCAQHDSPETVLDDADFAMYKAKETGKGGYLVYSPELRG